MRVRGNTKVSQDKRRRGVKTGENDAKANRQNIADSKVLLVCVRRGPELRKKERNDISSSPVNHKEVIHIVNPESQWTG